MFKNKIKMRVKDIIETNGRNNLGRSRYKHTMRVIDCAKLIQKVEGGDLEIVVYAALFHDIGWHEEIPHAIVSAKVAQKLLRKIDIPKAKKESIIKAIRKHSNKSAHPDTLTLEEKILIDADMLDEIGTLGILFSTSSSVTKLGQLNYLDVYKKIQFDLKKAEKRVLPNLKLSTSRNILIERMQFLRLYLKQMENEFLFS